MESCPVLYANFDKLRCVTVNNLELQALPFKVNCSNFCSSIIAINLQKTIEITCDRRKSVTTWQLKLMWSFCILFYSVHSRLSSSYFPHFMYFTLFHFKLQQTFWTTYLFFLKKFQIYFWNITIFKKYNFFFKKIIYSFFKTKITISLKNISTFLD